MKAKSLYFVGILLSLVLLSSMFLVGLTASQFPTDPQGEYSPWADLNDDGAIDIFDLVWMATRYGTAGTPVNKTELLYNVSETFAGLLSEIATLNAQVGFLEAKIAQLNSTQEGLLMNVAALEAELAIMNATKLGTPSFDSGWIPLAVGPNTVFFGESLHTLNTLVYVVGQRADQAAIHQIDYGGYVNVGFYSGVYWYDLTLNSIKINRHGNDGNWYYVRIMIWEIPEP